MDELDREIAEQLRRIIERAEERERLAEAYFSPTSVRFLLRFIYTLEKRRRESEQFKLWPVLNTKQGLVEIPVRNHYFYRPATKCCGKAMFSVVFVCRSVHSGCGGGGGVLPLYKAPVLVSPLSSV